MCEPWISALRSDMARLARTLQAALNDLERRSDAPLVGVTAPQHRPRTAADKWARQDNLED